MTNVGVLLLVLLVCGYIVIAFKMLQYTSQKEYKEELERKKNIQEQNKKYKKMIDFMNKQHF